MARKTRNHNEWFRSVSLGGRKNCPSCKEKLEQGEKIWSWGEYVFAKWRTVKHFCKKCYSEQVQTPLINHTDECGCTVNLIGYGGETLPEWLNLTCPIKKEKKAA